MKSDGNYKIPKLPLPYDLETKAVLKQLNKANRKLAELKGVAQTIPNENILISTLTLQEAKDSSEVENIVTTNDDLYKAELNLKSSIENASAKEVLSYRQAIRSGFETARKTKFITLNDIQRIQEELGCGHTGFRRVSGTALRTSSGELVYTPPQDMDEIAALLTNLENYINISLS